MKQQVLLSFLLYAILTAFFPISIDAQCNTGNENTCKCQTAPLLCSITELDGYQSYMASYQHPSDGPNGFCGQMTQSDNPNWFSFIAWCESFRMDVQLSNCVVSNNWIGVQLAIFDQCGTNNSIACNSDCNGNGTVSIDLNGLNIGQTYYFMMDGCFGATCDFTISVVQNGCNESIEDWTQGIVADEVYCKDGHGVFIVEEIVGAKYYHWYIDGDEIEITGDNQHEIQFGEEGVYELCVDVSNDCIDVSSNPERICREFLVVAPDAGELDYQSEYCPGDVANLVLQDYKNENDYSQYLITTDNTGLVINISQDESIFITSDQCNELIVYSLNFFNQYPITLPNIDDMYFGADCTETCCDEFSRTISFSDVTPPSFTNEPQSQSLNNLTDLLIMEAVTVTDNCDNTASIDGIETGFADLCDGGTIVRQWTYTDFCGNTNTHQQILDIAAAPNPISRLGEDVILNCESPEILLTTDLSTMTENTLVEWLDEDGNVLSTDESLVIKEAGIYQLALSDSIFMCYDSVDEIMVGFENTQAVTPLIPATILVQEFEEYLFEPTLTFEEASIINISWETSASLTCYDCLNPLMTIYEEGDLVELSIITENGCEYKFTSVIDIDFPTKIYVPNIFNPSLTEKFTMYSNGEVTEIKEAYIYDRWGNRLFSNFAFQANDVAQGWDGRIDGDEASSGVYVYMFVYEAKGEIGSVVGDITLVR